MNDEWIEVGSRKDFASAPAKVTVTGIPVVVWDRAGTLYAFSGRCPHAGAAMENCETDGAVMTCPLHGWRFDLTREGAELHGYRPLKMYSVKEMDGRVYVNCSSDMRSAVV